MPIFEAHGHSLHFSDEGTGTPIVLLHSSGMSSRQWKGLARILSTKHRVLCPDFLGAGKSSAIPDPFELTDDLELLHAWTRTLGDDVRIGGHSYGGLIALRLAILDPDRL